MTQPEFLGFLLTDVEFSSLTKFTIEHHRGYTELYNTCKKYRKDLRAVKLTSSSANSLSISIDAPIDILSKIEKEITKGFIMMNGNTLSINY